MRPKISIIVPIYNVEEYLSRCLHSILRQSLEDIEVITVNDGSTDSSLLILNEFAEKDSRVKIIDKPNAGVSSARNEGIKAAIGEFIGFVDPDDWVEKEMYEVLYKTANIDNADIVMCSYVREFESHTKEKKFNLPDKASFFNEEVKTKIMRRLVGPLNEEVGNPEFLDAWGTVWSKLYRAEILKENQLEFTDLTKIGTNEDSLFNIQAFYYANSFIFLNKPYYHYWRANNTSVTSSYKPNLMNQWFTLYKIIEAFLKEKGMQEEFYLALNNRICLNILGLGLNTISRSNKSTLLKKVKKLSTLLNDDRIKQSLQQLDLAPFPMVWRTFYFLAKSRIAIGLYFMLVSVDGLRKVMR